MYGIKTRKHTRRVSPLDMIFTYKYKYDDVRVVFLAVRTLDIHV